MTKPTLLIALALAALLLTPAPARAQERELDLPAYTALAREAAIAARRGDRLGLEDAGGRLAAVRSVRIPGGAPVAVDNRWLAEELARPTPNLPRAAERLEALVAALTLPPGAAPADARARLADLLGRPPFTRPDAGPPQWWLDFLDWLGRLIEQIIRPISGASPAAGGAISWAVAVVGALLLGGVIAYLAVGLRRALVGEARAADEDPEAHLTAKTAFEQAAELARAGDQRTAVRYLYLAALLRLDERGRLRYDRALTNREYLDRLRDAPDLRARLQPIVATFDRVWYGHQPLDDAQFAEYQAQVAALRGEP